MSSSSGRDSGRPVGPVASFEGSYRLTIDGAGPDACADVPSDMFFDAPATVTDTGEQVTATFAGELGAAMVAFVGTATLTGDRTETDFTVTARRPIGDASCGAETVVRFTWAFIGSWSGTMRFETVAPDAACGVVACGDGRQVNGQLIRE